MTTRSVNFITVFRSISGGRIVRNLSQPIHGYCSSNTPPYRRSRAGRKVRERLLKKFGSISTHHLPRREVNFTCNLHNSANHWTVYPQTNRGINWNNLRNLTKNVSIVPSLNVLKFANINARSVKNKIADIVDHVFGNEIDLCIFTETWMKEIDTACAAGLSIEGYLFKHFPRQSERQGGGTGIMFKETLDVSLCEGKENKSFEFSEWKVTLKHQNIKAAAVYRPPYSEMHPVSSSVFFEEFSDYLENIVMCQEILLIAGDFNFHLDNLTDPDTKKFNNLLNTFGLIQHVHVPTHISGHTLDLIITRSSNDILISNPQATFGISDHFFVECYLDLPRPTLSIKKINFRNMKQIDLENFVKDIASSDLSTSPATSLDELVKQYNSTLSTILNTHAPIKSKTITARHKVPWYNHDLKQLKTARRKLERKMLKSNKEADKTRYSAIRNEYSYLLRQTRKDYYSDTINKCAGDSKKLFQVVKSLCNERQVNNLPTHTDTTVLANEFGKFYCKKVELIQENISNSHVTAPVLEICSPSVKLSEFALVSIDEVKDIISLSSNATCTLDCIPTRLLKCCLDVLAPIITHMINKSLQTGHVTNEWKTALVIPLLKKTGCELTLQNYRPVSNLSFVSKILEKCVAQQILKHCANNALLPLNQSSYRQFHSTETALLKIQSDILMSMDQQNVTLLVLLDLSAAFDTVDHNLLLSILDHDFGISGTVYDWISSYLSNRKQRVVVNDTPSDEFDLKYGVPQGSCLGPILFLLYTSRLFHVVTKHLPDVHCFADDSQIYLSFKPESLQSQENAIKSMEHCISDIRAWMISNRLMINDSKTEFLIIGSRVQLSKINVECINIGNSSIKPSTSVRNLGAWFDQHMSMDIHVGKICTKAFYGLYKIRQIRKFLSPDTTKILVHAFVTSHLDYCNSLLYGIPLYQVNRLQKILNAAARVVLLLPKFDHITPALIKLHWLPVKYRIQFKILLLVYKALHGKAPPYLSDLVITKPISKYNLRNNNNSDLLVPSTKCKTFGDRSFAHAGPTLWNSLPNNIKSSQSLNLFKELLKTHLFKTAFNLD